MIRKRPVFALLFLPLLLVGCASDPAASPAPIENRTLSKPAPPSVAAKPRAGRAVNRDPDWRPGTHVVGKGETLYSIALEYGLDYKELAQWNGLADPNVIAVGQQLKLRGEEDQVVVKPLAPKKPLVQEAPLVPETPVAYPLALKLPYSETAVADLRRLLQPPLSAPATPVVTYRSSDGVPEPKPKIEAKPDVKASNNPPAKPENELSGDDEDLEWVWPTQGKLLSGYSEKGNKGYDIGGKKGQAIFSAGVGKVVYSGTGLRGYGKLIIIKHNKTYLSAYAHNQTILVKEGDNVAKGQKIAEMGDTDSDRVKLHFEIRRFGRPVDPSKYMPAEAKP